MVEPWKTAINPETGERKYLNPDSGTWEPYVTATNKETGERKYRTPEGEWAPVPEPDSSFVENLVAGTKSTANLLYHGTNAHGYSLLGELLGDEDNVFKEEAEKAFKKYVTNETAIQQKYNKFYDDYRDVETFNDALQYTQEALGRGIPSFMLPLVVGPLGRALYGTTGLNAGILMSTAAQNFPESYVGLRMEGVDAPVSAVVAGSIKSALDTAPPSLLLKNIYGEEVAGHILTKAIAKMFKDRGRGAFATGIRTFGTEGLTEAAQEAVDVAAEQFYKENPELFTEENLVRAIDAGLQGGLVGFGGGATTQALANKLQGTRFETMFNTPSQEEQEQEFERMTEGYEDPLIEQTRYVDEMVKKREQEVKELDKRIREIQFSDEMAQLPDYYPVSTGEGKSHVYTQGRFLLPHERNLGTPTKLPVENPFHATDNQWTKLLKSKEEQSKLYDKGFDSVLSPSGRQILPIDKRILDTKPKSEEDVTSRLKAIPITEPKRVKVRQSKAAFDYAKKAVFYEGPDMASQAEWQEFLQGNTFIKGKVAMRKIFKGIQDPGKISKKDVMKRVKEVGLTLPNFTGTPEHLRNAMDQALRGMNGLKVSREGMTFEDTSQEANENRLPPVDEVVAEETLPEVRDDYTLKQELEETLPTVLSDTEKSVSRKVEADIFNDVRMNKQDPNYDPKAELKRNHTMDLAVKIRKVKNKADLRRGFETYWHNFWASNNISQSDRGNIASESSLNKAAEKYAKVSGLNIEDVQRNYGLVLPTLFGEYMSNPDFEMVGLSRPLQRAFLKAEDLLNRTANVIYSKAPNAQSVSDLYDGLVQEDMQNYEESVRRSFNENEAYKNFEERTDSLMDDSISAFTDDSSPLNSGEDDHFYFDKIGTFVKNIIATPMFIAQKLPQFAPVEGLARTVNMETQRNLNRYLERVLEIQNARPMNFNIGMNLLAHLRMENIKKVRTSDGFFLFKDQKGRTHYTNPASVPETSPLRQFYNDFNEITNIFEQHVSDVENIIKDNFLVHGIDVNQDSKSVVTQAKKVRERLRKEVELGESDLVKTLAEKEVQELTDAVKAFAIVQRVKNSYYVPFLRFGSRVVSVHSPEEKDPVYVAFVEESKSGTMNKKQVELIRKELKEKGFMDSSKYTVKGLRPGEVKRPTESKSQKLLEDLGLQGVDPTIFGQSLQMNLLQISDEKGYQYARDKLNKLANLDAISGVFGKARNIPGYSTDWARVVNTWGYSSANFLSKLKYRGAISDMGGYVHNVENAGVTPREAEYIKEYFDYAFSYKTDLPGFRAWNFFLVMGGNPSTAALQLLNGPMAVVPYVMGYRGNVLTENARFAKFAVQNSTILGTFKFSTGQLKGIKDPATHAKWEKSFGKEVADTLKRFVEDGHIEALFTLDHSDNRRSETRDLFGHGIALKEKTMKYAGSFISAGEQQSRLNSVAYIADSLTDPEALARHRDMLKDDKRFHALRKALPNYTEKQAMVLHALDTTHGVFGKAGRGFLQRGYWGALITPFMTHPSHQIQLLANLLRGKTMKEKMAGMWMMSTYMIMGGMMALPGMELMSEFYELFVKALFGTEEDAEKNFREFLVNEAKLSPEVAMTVMRGIPRGMEGNWITGSRVSLSPRVNLALPFQQPALTLAKFLKGQEGAMADVLGPSVGYAGNVADYIKTKDPKTLMPLTMKNAYKGLIDYGWIEDLSGGMIKGSQKGARTISGTPLASPEELSQLDKFYQTLGFRPGLVVDRQERKYYERLAGTFFLPEYQRSIKEMADIYVKMYKANLKGDKERGEMFKNQLNAGYKDLMHFLQKNKVPVNKTRLMAIKRSIREKVWASVYPEYSPHITKMGRESAPEIERVFDPYSTKKEE